VHERKRIIRDILSEAPIFREILDIARRAGRPLTRDEALGTISAQVGSHNAQDFFRALIYWGRYAELLRYDSESEEVTLRLPPL
jgi:NitT/TauT family transport system ATP-binding protein